MGSKEAYERIDALRNKHTDPNDEGDYWFYTVYTECMKIIEEECPEVKANDKQIRKCIECGKEYIIRHPSQKFCCRKCKDRYWNRIKAEQHKEEHWHDEVMANLDEW